MMNEMKHEMHSWDRERRARRFARGFGMILVSATFFVCHLPIIGVVLLVSGGILLYRSA